MRVLIMGGVSRLGQMFIQEANIRQVTCQTYDDDVIGNVDAVDKMVRDADIILSFRGGSFHSLSQNIQIMSMASRYNKKFMLVSSFGCGSSWNRLSNKAKDLFGEKIKYKTLSETWLKLSDLPWMIIRPVGLTDIISNEETIVTSDNNFTYGYINRGCLVKVLIKIINSEWNERGVLYAYTKKEHDTNQ